MYEKGVGPTYQRSATPRIHVIFRVRSDDQIQLVLTIGTSLPFAFRRSKGIVPSATNKDPQ